MYSKRINTIMKKYLLALFSIALAVFTYNQVNQAALSAATDTSTGDITMSDTTALATFAGGCFWCMEAPFEYEDGVISVISGYAGGKASTANYKAVSSGRSEHLEVVQVKYDPSKISYEALLDIFWRQIDPTDAGGSFVDRGKQYSSAIFYHDKQQEKAADASKQALNDSKLFDSPVATEVRAFDAFYPAEDYHQDYYKENTLRYKLYRNGSGRDSDKELKASLSKIQYKVTQKDGTERAFTGENWDNKADGIYVDIVSGEPLFSSTHKYKSGTGWPSFWDTIEKGTIVEKEDNKLWAKRIELRSFS